MSTRQAPQGLGVIQRQVTARPTQALQAARTDYHVEPNQFAQGLAAFAETGSAIARQQVADNRDAQAAVADIGLDGYQRAMKARLESEPDLFDRPDDVAKFDQELRDSYFKDLTDDDIRKRVTMRVDGLLQSTGTTYQYEKEAKQRFDLGSRTMQLNVEKLEEQVAAGALTREAATGQIRELLKTLQTSPSFRMSKEHSEKLVQTLQEAYAKDGSRRLLLAEAFKDDENISTETRLTLHLDQVEALKQTEQEKQAKQFELFKSWEPLIESGKFTWAMGEKAVKAGVVSASDVRSSMRRQQTQMEKRIKEAKESAALVTGNPLEMDPKTFKKWEAQARGALPKEQYYSLMHQTGGVNPVVKAQAERAFSSASSMVETEDQIPQAFKQYMAGDAALLYGNGMLSQHIPPEQLEDTVSYLYMTRDLGKSPVEAYNLMVQSAASKYSDIDKLRQQGLKNQVRSSLDLPKDAANSIVDTTVSLSMKLVKQGLDPDVAVKQAVGWTKQAYTTTPYGAIPKAYYGSYASEDALKKRIDFAAKELAKAQTEAGTELSPKDLTVNMLSDGRFFYTRRGGVAPVGARSFRLMVDNATETPDGTQTVEGQRQEEVINDQFQPSAFDGLTPSSLWQGR